MNQGSDTKTASSRRIRIIRSRLKKNTYNVDIEQITSKFLDLEIALAGASKALAA